MAVFEQERAIRVSTKRIRTHQLRVSLKIALPLGGDTVSRASKAPKASKAFKTSQACKASKAPNASQACKATKTPEASEVPVCFERFRCFRCI